MREKQILTQLIGVPFTVQIKQTFMDPNNLYFVFEHLPWGTLTDLIKAQGKLNEDLARIYAAQIVVALKELHNRKIMH